MNKPDFHKDEFYEDYIMGRLSPDEESRFEEHLLFCDRCRIQLENTEALIAGVSNAQKKTIGSPAKKTTFRWSIAASILLLVGLAILYFTRPFGSEHTVISHPVAGTDTSQVKKSVPVDTTDTTQTTTDKKPQEHDVQLYAEAFRPLPVYENAIGSEVRSAELEMLKPVNSQIFNVNDSLIFEWKGTGKQIILAIFNNKGVLQFEQKVNSPFYLKKQLADGLYYFQLETEEESLYTGKFLIKKQGK